MDVFCLQELAVSIFTTHAPADPKERASRKSKGGSEAAGALDAGQLKGKLATTHCFASGRRLGGETATR